MAILCKSYNLLFMMSPRTACSAIGKALKQNLDGVFLPEKDVLNENGHVIVRRKHCTLQELIENGFLAERELSSLTVFTGVRNPFDSLASLYEKKKTKYKHLLSKPDSWIYKRPGHVEDIKFCQTHSFDEWIVKSYAPSWTKRILGKGKQSLFEQYIDRTDAIIRFENLQNDFKSVLKQAGVDRDVEIPLFNATPERANCYRSYYSEISRDIVSYVFQHDLNKFGYKF